MSRLGFGSKYLVTAVVAGSVWFTPGLVGAQEESEPTIIYQKKTIVSFGEDTIDGDLLVPDGEYVESRKRVRHSNLIRIRENFHNEILRSVSGL